VLNRRCVLAALTELDHRLRRFTSGAWRSSFSASATSDDGVSSNVTASFEIVVIVG